MEKITIDKDELSKQRLEEIKKSDSYFQILIACPNLPNEKLESIGDETADDDGLVLVEDFIVKSIDFAEQNIDYSPLVICTGKSVSVMDRLIAINRAKLCLLEYEEKFLEEFEEKNK